MAEWQSFCRRTEGSSGVERDAIKQVEGRNRALQTRHKARYSESECGDLEAGRIVVGEDDGCGGGGRSP